MQDYAFIQVAIRHHSNSTSSSMANVHFEDPEDSSVSLQVPAIPPKQHRTAGEFLNVNHYDLPSS